MIHGTEAKGSLQEEGVIISNSRLGGGATLSDAERRRQGAGKADESASRAPRIGTSSASAWSLSSPPPPFPYSQQTVRIGLTATSFVPPPSLRSATHSHLIPTTPACCPPPSTRPPHFRISLLSSQPGHICHPVYFLSASSIVRCVSTSSLSPTCYVSGDPPSFIMEDSGVFNFDVRAGQ